MRPTLFGAFAIGSLAFHASSPEMTREAVLPPSLTTQVVLLGTGTPGPDPDRSGPATAIIVNGVPYLVDFGPGVVRRASAAERAGVRALASGNIRTAFLTHLHSDHTAGLADLVLIPWAVGRDRPLQLYGPAGLEKMAHHILQAYSEDIAIRTADKQELGLKGYDAGIKVNVHEIRPGVVFRDASISVTAFQVRHGDVRNAFGFRFQTPDRSIVISGDTSPAQTVIDACNGCDILIHEAYSLETHAKVSPAYQSYRRKHHTSSRELADLASRARPKLLVLYHRANPGGYGMRNPEQAVLREVQAVYRGAVVTGHDLDVF